MADPELSRLVPVILIILVLVAAGVGAGLLFYYGHPRPTPAVETVAVGDNVTVNYIGTFGSGPQVGRVFDTSIYSVATNNLSYPKSLEFTMRASPSDYTPLPVYVGPNAPSAGYAIGNLTFGSVVPGFWQGLLGLPVNDTHSITVPPSLGYGSLDPSCLVTAPLTLRVPVVEVDPPVNFTTDYPNVSASVGTEFLAAPYNWTALVLNVNATAVTFENLPTVNESVRADGLPARVAAINSTTITVAVELTAANQGSLLGHASQTVCGTSSFLIQSVDPSAGTYVQNFNREVVGETLIFTVTVVKFY